MSITYPISLPGLARTTTPIILQSPDSTKWRIFIGIDGGQDGILKAESGASGTPQNLILTDSSGQAWRIDISNAGILSANTTASVGVTEVVIRSDDTTNTWALSITTAGILQADPLANSEYNTAFRAMTFRPLAVVGVSRSPFTLQQQVQAHQGQLWAVEAQVRPMLRADAEAWIAALLSLNGMQGTFFLGDPLGHTPRGSVAGTPLAAAGSSGQVLLSSGWTASTANVLLPGDWVQLGSGTTQRIYRVLKHVSSDGSGNATINIWPRLREIPAAGDAITYRRTSGVFRLATNEMDYSMEIAQVYGIEISAVEAI